MARINLGREQGVRVVGSAQHGATSPAGYEHLAGGYERLNRARESISRSVAYASDVFMKAFNDLAETRNRQEILEGRTKLFDITNQANTALEERINNGDFDNPNGLALFKEAVRASHVQVEKDFNEWSAQNVTQNSTRNALNEDARLDFKRNFAHLSGVFLAHDRRRRWDMFQNQANNAIKSGNYENLKIAYHAFVGGGKDKDGNDIPYTKSEEFCKNLWADLDYKFCAQRISDAKNQIADATTPEAITEIIANFQSSGYFSEIPENQRKSLTAFSARRVLETESSRGRKYEAERQKVEAEKKETDRQAEEARKLKEKETADAIAGKKAEMSAAIRLCVETGTRIEEDAKLKEQRNNLIEIIKSSGLSEGKKKSLIADLDDWLAEEQKHIVDQVQSLMFDNTVSVLIEAVNQKDGNIDPKILSGGDAKEAEQIKKSRDANEYLLERANKGTLDQKGREFFVNYRKEYFALLNGIFTYDKVKDPRGERLAELIKKSQGFERESRKELLEFIYEKAVKNSRISASWKDADIETFDNAFAEICVWEDNLNARWWLPKMWEGEDTSNPKAFKKMRDRILNIAQARGLTVNEAIEELKKDPFYQEILTKRATNEALNFLEQ